MILLAKIILVTSGKGGVGKSTFTAGISSALCEMDKKVLAIDCDIALRSLDLLLGHTADVVFDWGDVLLERCTPEDAVVKGSVDFIAAPRAYDDYYTPEAFVEMVKSFKDSYDYIFIDSPAGIGSGFHIAAAPAESAIVITTPDSICVRSCSVAFDELEKMGITDTRLIVNMFEAKAVCNGRLLNIDECIDETGVQLIGVIPMDREFGFCSVACEEPGEFLPGTLAFLRIAKRLEGGRAKLIYR